MPDFSRGISRVNTDFLSEELTCRQTKSFWWLNTRRTAMAQGLKLNGLIGG